MRVSGNRLVLHLRTRSEHLQLGRYVFAGLKPLPPFEGDILPIQSTTVTFGTSKLSSVNLYHIAPNCKALGMHHAAINFDTVWQDSLSDARHSWGLGIEVLRGCAKSAWKRHRGRRDSCQDCLGDRGLRADGSEQERRAMQLSLLTTPDAAGVLCATELHTATSRICSQNGMRQLSLRRQGLSKVLRVSLTAPSFLILRA